MDPEQPTPEAGLQQSPPAEPTPPDWLLIAGLLMGLMAIAWALLVRAKVSGPSLAPLVLGSLGFCLAVLSFFIAKRPLSIWKPIALLVDFVGIVLGVLSVRPPS